MKPSTEKLTFPNAQRPSGVSLWDLLTLMSGGSAFGNTYAAIILAKLESGRRIAALVAGIVISILCVWFVRGIGRLLTRSQPPSEWKLRFVYGLTFLWLFLAGLIGFQVEKLFIQLVLLP
jgi:hypothetical protein